MLGVKEGVQRRLKEVAMVDVPGWAIGVGIIILASSVGRALGMFGPSRAHRAARPGPEVDISGVREALDDVQRRLGEMEERLDFAERLLAKPRDVERGALPPK
jgi:hypothetical protein